MRSASLPQPAVDREAFFAFLAFEASLIIHVVFGIALVGWIERYEIGMVIHQGLDDPEVIFDVRL